MSNNQRRHCERKRSNRCRRERMDCFVAALLAMTAGHDGHTRIRGLAARSARAMPENFRPFQMEGVGNAGRSMHPQPRMRIGVVNMHASIHSEAPGQPGIPARNGLRPISCSPRRDRAQLPPSPCGSRVVRPGLAEKTSARLDAGVEASGPHDFTVRVSIVRQRTV